jgi:biotin transporter BioY
MTTIHPKVAAGSIAGGLSIIAVWVAGLFGLDVPPEVASAFTVVVSGTAGYLKPGLS